VRQTCLYLATILGDLLEDIVVVGGLVPSLIIPQHGAHGIEPHVGTHDLDLGLALALLDDQLYCEISKRLRDADFEPDENSGGNITSQRWMYEKGEVTVTLDFLIPSTEADSRGGTLKNLEQDFAAIITPGLHLAFIDFVTIVIDGTTLRDETATREIKVCGVGAFIVLKALAVKNRRKIKDAYDLFYVVRNHGSSVTDVAQCVQPHLEDKHARDALDIIRDNFLDYDAIGPSRVADFVYRRPDDELQAEVVAWMRDLLDELGWT
jgi:hypothetical protein